jgi:transcriptional regulator with PAS, ATPase and Fis domain
MESELFGHEKGSFTGADQATPGRLQIPEGRTISSTKSAKSLLSCRPSFYVHSSRRNSVAWGSTKSVGSDVRVIATTNKTLEEEVRTGKFRKHLYFRLNVLTIKLPPMRQRVDDIRDLAETFLDRIANATGQSHQRRSRKRRCAY